MSAKPPVKAKPERDVVAARKAGIVAANDELRKLGQSLARIARGVCWALAAFCVYKASNMLWFVWWATDLSAFQEAGASSYATAWGVLAMVFLIAAKK